jgi:hypothetical protein
LGIGRRLLDLPGVLRVGSAVLPRLSARLGVHRRGPEQPPGCNRTGDSG